MAESQGEGEWGLIFCGGAMRNTFSAGVAWALWRAGFKGEFFNRIIGISGGSGTAAYFLTDQLVEGRRIWLEEVPKGLIRFRYPILDLHFLTETVFRERVPLDVARLRATKTQFDIAITDCETGRAIYVNGADGDVFKALRASMALFPCHGPEPYRDDGRLGIDGCHADPIPLSRMFAMDIRKILVVLTDPISERATRINPLLRWIAEYILPPRAALALRLSPSRYNDRLVMMGRPINGATIVTVAPPVPTPAGRLTRDPRLLEATMEMGCKAMQSIIASKQFP